MSTLGALTPITNHFEQAVSKLIERYRDKPLFLAWLESYVKQVQELEDATWQVIESRFLENADDLRAELLGRLVGQPRRGESLATYKLYISVRILVNRSLARAKDVIQIANVILGEDPAEGVLYDEGGANFMLTTRDELGPGIDPEVLVEMVHQAKGAGIGFLFVYHTSPDSEMFKYASTLDGTFEASSAHGYGSTTEVTGGKLASAIDGRATNYLGV